MINSLPSVTINGQPTFLGGYIFSLQRQINFGDAPSTCNITLISENGQFLDTELSTQTIYNINIGNKINLDYYAVTAKESKSAQGKLLTVEFEDQSVILDRYYVGLHKRHGNSTPNQNYSINGRFLIVGQEFSPCDQNGDGIINDLDNYISPCDPCPTCPEDKYVNFCEDLQCRSILEVGYNFSTLLRGIQALGIGIVNSPSSNDNFFCEYVGTIREVLNNWCAELGYAFTWDENNKIRFIDRRTAITINEQIPRSLCSDYEITKTLKGTESRAAVSYFAREGDEQNFDCTKVDYPQLQCLKISDIYPTGYLGTTVKDLEASAVFSHYVSDRGNPIFRDAYWWYTKYGIINSGELEHRRSLGTVMSELGDMKILNRIDDTTPNITQDATNPFLDYLGNQTVDPYEAILGGISETERNFITGRQGYFFIAQRNEELAEKRIAIEQRLSDEFLGQHFIKVYNPTFCGGGYRDGSVQVNSPNSAREKGFFPQGASVIGLPFCQFDHQRNSTVSKITGFSPPYDNLDDGLVYMRKEPVWSPNNQQTGWKKFEQQVASGLFWQVGLGRTDILTRINSSGSADSNIKLYVAFPGTFGVFTGFSHNEDDEPKNVRVDYPAFSGTCFPNAAPVKYYGLSDNKCGFLTVSGYQFKTPSQAVEFGGLEYLGYTVQLLQSYNQTVFIPKIQTSKVDFVGISDNTLNMSVNFHTIQDEDIRAIRGDRCTPNDEVIQEIHDRFNKDLTYDSSFIREQRSFTVNGIDVPVVPTIEDGLVSMDVSQTSKGIQTSYVFANSPPNPPSLDVVRREVELNRRKPTLR